MSTDSSERLREAQRNFDNLVGRVNDTTESAHRDVTTLLKKALTVLFNVVAVSKVGYAELGKPDFRLIDMMQWMKESFEAMEATAANRSNDLSTLHTEVCVRGYTF